MNAHSQVPAVKEPTPPPQNIEAEQALLGALLCNNDVLHKIGRLRPDHFYDPVHANIFELARARILAGKLVSPVTMKGYLDNHPGLAELGGPKYLVRLAGAAISIFAAADFAGTIIECHVRRQVGHMADQMEEWVSSGNPDLGAISTEVEGQLLDLRAEVEGAPVSMSFAAAAVQSIVHINELYQTDGASGMVTGLRALDDLLGPLIGGRIYILGGRPAMGKTSTGLQVATNMALSKSHDGLGQGVMFVSLEMSANELMTRFWSAELRRRGGNVPYFVMEKGKIGEADFRELTLAAKDLENTPLQIVTPPYELAEVIAAIRSAARGHSAAAPLRCIIVDYLQLIGIRSARSPFEVPGKVTKALKRVSQELGVPIIILSQLNRNIEQRDLMNRKPTAADLRNSGEIEEDAHAIIFTYRHSVYLEKLIESMSSDETGERAVYEAELPFVKNRMELIVDKNRSGPTGTAAFHIEIQHNLIRDFEQSKLEGFA